MKGSIVDDYRDPLFVAEPQVGDKVKIDISKGLHNLSIVQVITPQDCQSGACDCTTSSLCYFKRCANCNNILHAVTGRAYFQCTGFDMALSGCPFCGGDTR